jgi:hypothetical protein
MWIEICVLYKVNLEFFFIFTGFWPVIIKLRFLLTAGTTEKIFETKPHLYDVYVDNQNVTTSSATLKDILKVSDTDRDKFQKLNNQRYDFICNVTTQSVRRQGLYVVVSLDFPFDWTTAVQTVLQRYQKNTIGTNQITISPEEWTWRTVVAGKGCNRFAWFQAKLTLAIV